MKKKEIVELNIVDMYGNLTKVKGIKQIKGKLLIPNPYHQKRIKIIERKPDT